MLFALLFAAFVGGTAVHLLLSGSCARSNQDAVLYRRRWEAALLEVQILQDDRDGQDEELERLRNQLRIAEARIWAAENPGFIVYDQPAVRSPSPQLRPVK